MRNIRLEIGGMSCEHCVKRVKKAIEELPGVASVEVTLGKALVTFQEKAVSESDIIKAIEKAGYTIAQV